MDDQSHPIQNKAPSSASSGTFLASPKLENQYHSDASLQRIVELFLPPAIIQSTNQDFTRIGDEVISKQVFDWVGNAERNPPYLKGSGRDAFGHRTDELVTSEGWRKLQSMGFREGAMQDGAASLLKRHLSSTSLDPITRSVFQAAFSRLISRDDDAWTSGQWMTERIGGSDVSGTETLARRLLINEHTPATELNGSPLGPWVLDGFKWFSSATDAQMSIALARSEKGLSAFYIPMRRMTPKKDSELNGISISRLKNKLGTKAVPTAELELKGVRAHLVGTEGDGVRTISTLLNITRVHNSVTSVGLLGRGLSIARSFAVVRELVGKGNKKTLKDVALHVRTLADITLSYRANMLFTFFTIYCLGISEQDNPSATTLPSIASDRLWPRNLGDHRLMLRLLTPALKALTAKASIAGLQECMESLGGIGYLDNEESQHINVSRLYRDANVLSIWEGTTNVLGTDFVKVLKSRSSTFPALENWLQHVLFESCTGPTIFAREKNSLLKKLQAFKLRVQEKDKEELFLDARNLMAELSSVVIGSLMIVDAESGGDEVSVELLRRYGEIHGFSEPAALDWKQKAALDAKIVFGGMAGYGKEVQARL
ncbi:hypothetical protein B7494_g3530 [Chlorociboria aeruginascens]|nr:hypothetical protein B7494_g3530 [Chlorociboria aeruginascens]